MVEYLMRLYHEMQCHLWEIENNIDLMEAVLINLMIAKPPSRLERLANHMARNRVTNKMNDLVDDGAKMLRLAADLGVDLKTRHEAG